MTNLPLYSLKIQSPKLTLRVANEQEILELFNKAHNNILDENNHYYLASNWATQDKETIIKTGYNWMSLNKAQFDKTGNLILTAFDNDNNSIGNMDLGLNLISGSSLEDKMMKMGTGSWILKNLQGQGYGYEMRRMVLEFAFNYLNILEANSSYIDDNIPSAKVSEKLGYKINGVEYYKARDNKIHEHIHVRLIKEDWQDQNDIKVIGFNEVKGYFNI